MQSRAEAHAVEIYEMWIAEEVELAEQRVMDSRVADTTEAARVAKIIKADIEAGHLNRQFSVNPADPSTWNGATPEARARAEAATGKPGVAKICPIERMYDRGRIDDDAYRAAQEIVRAVEIITADVAPRLMRYEERVDGLFNQERMDAIEGYHEHLLIRYGLWREAMAMELISYGAVCNVLVEGQTLKDTDRAYRKKNGWTSGQVVEALKLYVYVNRPTGKL